MVARGDEHRRGDPAQGGGQRLGGLPVGLPVIQQIAGEKDQVGPPLAGCVGQLLQQKPLLGPPLAGLIPAVSAAKGASRWRSAA